MAILLYDYNELEDNTFHRHLHIWRAFHVILFILAAVFGILNYNSLLYTNDTIDEKCVLFPRVLEFKWVPLTQEGYVIDDSKSDIAVSDGEDYENDSIILRKENEDTMFRMIKRDVKQNSLDILNEDRISIVTENSTNCMMLDVDRSLFAKEKYCEFPTYMPILAAVFAMVWGVLFIMCPAGGKVRSSQLTQPWRILVPALAFSIIMVILTGINFNITNAGLQDFCASFRNYTHDTECSSANRFLLSTYNSTWGLAERVAVTRAAVAASFACWLCACALLLARCIAAPDFSVKKTKIFLKDPAKKIIPHLPRSQLNYFPQSAPCSPSEHTSALPKSEPTSSELVTASIENELPSESEPTSLLSTPAKASPLRKGELIEMTVQQHCGSNEKINGEPSSN